MAIRVFSMIIIAGEGGNKDKNEDEEPPPIEVVPGVGDAGSGGFDGNFASKDGGFGIFVVSGAVVSENVNAWSVSIYVSSNLNGATSVTKADDTRFRI